MFGANTPWQRVKWTLDSGARAASGAWVWPWVADLMKEGSAGERLGRSFNALVELDEKQISDAMDDVIRITECALSFVVPGFACDKDEN